MPNLSATPQGRQRPAGNGYEKRDARAGWIFGVVAFLLAAGLIMHFCLAGVTQRLKRTPAPSDGWPEPRPGSFPEKSFPRLQISPPEDLETFREQEEKELKTYGWIDRTAGVVRIPVDRAMELVLERGLPVRSGTNEGPLGPSSYELMQQRPKHTQPEIQK